MRVGPMLNSPFPDSPVDRVEVCLGDQECVVLWSHVAAVDEVEAHAVVESDRKKRAEGLGGR